MWIEDWSNIKETKQANAEVLGRLKITRELLTELFFLNRQTKYLGPIKRHNTRMKTILAGKIEGSRARDLQGYK